jgi:hypothetical protein
MIPTDTNQVLPSVILLPPPTMPLITKDMKIERAWYLCLRQIIAQLGGFTAPPLSVTDLQELTDQNLDLATVDVAALPALIQSMQSVALDSDLSEAPTKQETADAMLIAMNALDNADASTTGFATPTATVGLSAKPGTTQSAIRSDGAPALDVSITVTWTGIHTFSKNVIVGPPVAGTPLIVNVLTSSGAGLQVTGYSSGQNAADIEVTRSSSANTPTAGPNVFFQDGTSANTSMIQMGAGTLGLWNLGRGFWSEVVSIAPQGNVTLAAPGSGDTLIVAPSVGTGALMATSAALANGAAAAAGTLTNAPAAGNPTKWISINDNGTIRKIPAW